MARLHHSPILLLPTVVESKGATGTSKTFVLHNKVEDAPNWAVPYGKEFWHRAKADVRTKRDPASKRTAIVATDFHLGDIVDRVSHAITRDATAHHLRVKAANYAAEFDGEGLRFFPDWPDGNGPMRRTLVGPSADESIDDHAPRAASNDEPAASTGHPGGRGFPVLDPHAEGVLSTLSIRQGEDVLYERSARASSWSVLGNTAQILRNDRVGIIEHYEAREEGVEVSWVLQNPPTSDGSVEIEFEVRGLHYAGSSATGHHFADGFGMARMRVGNVSAVDAGGQSWELRTQVKDTRVRIRVPKVILNGATYPVAIDPVVSPEFGMDAPLVAPASEIQRHPSVASNGSDYLVVWEDYRTGSSSYMDIYGAIVSLAGVVMNPSGLVISAAPSNEYGPVVASNGKDYLVVWQDPRGEFPPNIVGARVAAGKVLDPDGIPICTAEGYQRSPAVASDGDGYFVVWSDERNRGVSGSDIYGGRVNSGGAVLDPDGILISASPGDQELPTIVANGTNYFVAWEDHVAFQDADIAGTIVSSGGWVKDPGGLVIYSALGRQQKPSVATSGSEYLIVWEDAGKGYRIYGARVSADGVLIDQSAIPISTGTVQRFSPKTVWDGSDYLVAWEDERSVSTNGFDIYGTHVTRQGSVLEPEGIGLATAPGNQLTPALALSGGNILLAWTDQRNESTSGQDIYGAIIPAANPAGGSAGFPVSVGAHPQYGPAAAFNGTNYLVVWQDGRNTEATGYDIYATRLAPDGTVLDPSGIAVCTAPNSQETPAAASNGQDYFVV